ncbi:hypothetical protein PV08_06379 [Exophiala spinifera]|uniref:Uncharacterized protein n=1 Tax=Exophiala spinifera TaxID=91928 RepID=A0A0D2BBE2_9EURO|nr:uncharacterized protein PV08_06379 [Exophiala spinifera]KIW16328.1 hypothetical protein PV08_06379 [Exophiala spinifera]
MEGKIQGRFDSKKPEKAVKEVVRKRKLPEDTLHRSTGDGACQVWVRTRVVEGGHTDIGRYVCATSKETSKTVCLTSYKTPRGNDDLLNSTTISEACRAMSAASSFFDLTAIGRYGEESVYVVHPVRLVKPIATSMITTKPTPLISRAQQGVAALAQG